MKYIVLDFETTGLATKEKIVDGKVVQYPAEIIEIGITEIIDGKIGRNMSKFVKPKRPIPFNITQITNITNDMVKDAKLIEQILPAFRKYIGDNTVIAHNGSRYDIPLINYYLGKNNLPLITNCIDTILLLKSTPGYNGENNKLGTACEYYGIKNIAAHRAYADTYATAKLFLTLEKENGRMIV